MQPLPTLLVPHLLLPDWDVGAIVANLGVEGRERGPKEDEGRLLGGEISLESCPRPLVGHGGSCGRMTEQGKS